MDKKQASNKEPKSKPEVAETVNDIYRKVNEIQNKAERKLAELSQLCAPKGTQD